jgi:hypothetical protein
VYVPLPVLIAVGLVVLGMAMMLLRRGNARRDLMTPPAALPGTRPRWTPPPASPGTLSGETEAEVWDLLRADQVISAIKLVRETTGLGLKEARDLVDDMRRHEPPPR